MLLPDQKIELTWITGQGGTEGAETIVTVGLPPHITGTHLRLVHAGFYTAESRDTHEVAWPLVLAQLDERISLM